MNDEQPRCVFCGRKMEFNLSLKISKNRREEYWSCPHDCGNRLKREVIIDNKKLEEQNSCNKRR